MPCQLATARRPVEAGTLWRAFSARGQQGSPECHPEANKRVIDVRTSPAQPPPTNAAIARICAGLSVEVEERPLAYLPFFFSSPAHSTPPSAVPPLPPPSRQDWVAPYERAWEGNCMVERIRFNFFLPPSFLEGGGAPRWHPLSSWLSTPPQQSAWLVAHMSAPAVCLCCMLLRSVGHCFWFPRVLRHKGKTL